MTVNDLRTCIFSVFLLFLGLISSPFPSGLVENKREKTNDLGFVLFERDFIKMAF